MVLTLNRKRRILRLCRSFGCGNPLYEDDRWIGRHLEGQIKIGTRDVTRADPADRSVAMVFQTYALYPHMNVEENMGFGLKMNGLPKRQFARKSKSR